MKGENKTYLHPDGKEKSFKFNGNQHEGFTADIVKNAKTKDIRLAKAGKVLGAIGVVATVADIALDSYAYSKGKISGERLTYRLVGTGAGMIIAAFAIPEAIVFGGIWSGSEYIYDEAPRQFKQAQDRENIHSMNDFNKAAVDFFSKYP